MKTAKYIILSILFSALMQPAAFARQLSPERVEQVRDIMSRIEQKPHIVTPGYLAELDARIDKEQGDEKLALFSWRAFYVDEYSENDVALKFNTRLADMASEMDNARYQTMARLERIYLETQFIESEEAIRRMQGALDEALATKDPVIIVDTYVNFAYASATANQANYAMQLLQAALPYLDRIKHGDWQRLELFGVMIYVGTTLSDQDLIIDSLTQLLDAADSLDLRIGGDIEAFNMGRAFLDTENFDIAEEIYSRLDVLVTDTTGYDSIDRYFALIGLAEATYGLENYRRALEIAREALDQYDGPPVFDAELLLVVGRSLAQTGDSDGAFAAIDRAAKILEAQPDFAGSRSEARLLRARGEAYRAAGDYDAAFAAFDKQLDIQMEALRDQYSADMAGVRSTLGSELQRERVQTRLMRSLLDTRTQFEYMLIVMALAAIAALLAQIVVSRKLRASRKKAEAANTAKSEFLANMSHELRTPLNAIIGFSDMIASRTLGPIGHPQYEEYASVIYKSGNHLLDIINDMLDLARIEAGKIELSERKWRIGPLMDEVTELLVHPASEAGLTMTCRLEDPEVRLHCDRRLIKQAVLNLASNSVKFTPAGGNISLYTEARDDGGLTIAIEDDGIGMSEGELAVASEPFGQVQSIMTRSHEGAGLGIPLVKAFMELHGGEVDIRTAKNNGTKVRLILPKSRVVAAKAVDEAVSKQAQESAAA